MDRKDEIRETGNRMMKQVLWDSLQELMADYKSREEIHLREFSDILQQLFALTAQRQREGTKGRACYLGICYCLSSVFTGNYEMKLDIYDKEMYLDENECCLYWRPGFIFDYYQRDMEYFRKNIGKEVPRVRTYEIQQYGTGYLLNYMHILSEFLHQKLPEVMEKISPEELQTDGKLQFFFGKYMDRGVILYEENRDEIF